MPKKITTKDFIKKSNIIHGYKYNYSLCNYKAHNVKVKLICPNHGKFEVTPNNHISNKRGCQKCGYESTSKKNSINKSEFVKKANTIHNNKYDYSLFKYKKSIDKSIIICPYHGKFEQDAHNHLAGKGCNMCAGNKKLTTETFIKKSKSSHGDIYDYSKSNYINATKKVIITCKKHGDFEQLPRKHMYEKNGCPICSESKGEKEIRIFLKNNNIQYEYQKKFSDCKYKTTLPFDFYIPKYNMCIEYNGEQHYKPINHWGGENKLKEIKERDKIKAEYCKKNNIQLKVISYNQNINKKLLNLFKIYNHTL